MPAKRVKSKARNRITPEALEAYRQGEWLLLHRYLGLKPWEASPLDAQPGVNNGPISGVYERTIPQARQLRAELEHDGVGVSSNSGSTATYHPLGRRSMI
jgi:hypothetical protein